MPELPEVETVKRGLAKYLPGLEVKSVDHDWPKSFPNAPQDVKQFLIGAKITGVRRRAKVLIIDLNSSYSLVTHLRMTGQLVFVGAPMKPKLRTTNSELRARFGAGHPNDSLVGSLPDKSTRVEITFVNNSKLFFNDQRKFGWMRLIPSEEIQEMPFFKKVGPEPLAPDFTPEVFIERLKRRKNTSIKAALLDQTVLAGIGNIYADEALWGAKIHPATKVKDIREEVLKDLHKEIIYVLELSIEKGGSTDRNYVNADGKKGSYIDFARVFRREGKPCPRCNRHIIKTRVASRGTHTCPICQPE